MGRGKYRSVLDGACMVFIWEVFKNFRWLGFIFDDFDLGDLGWGLGVSIF